MEDEEDLDDLEAMEAEGVIGPSDGTSRPREVLVGSMQ